MFKSILINVKINKIKVKIEIFTQIFLIDIFQLA